MRERLRQLGGTLEINSTGTGTLVTARLPVQDPSRAANVLSVSDSSSMAAA